jgi:2,4-dienoyl-CoA reductase-like NADH-dependent reductase (Old Yellow Enzyme family)
MGVQLAHAGRKAWSRARGEGPEEAVAPSPLPHSDEWRTPHALTTSEIEEVVAAWRAAAARADAAGFDVVEVHGAHGYLNHEFLSPISNHRTDDYGGDLGARMRFLLEVVEAVRESWPEEKPLLVRLSATDWVAGGLTVDDTVEIARALRERGVDLVDCSSGGITPGGPEDPGPGFQIPFAEAVRSGAGVATAAVGLITTPELADATVRNERADLVALGRELLRHPYWPLDAARILGEEGPWPEQYRRARLG